MSGTSHDGLDIAYCSFKEQAGTWEYEIIKASTIPYPSDWRSRLIELINADDDAIKIADLELGHYIGKAINTFISSYLIM